MLPRFIAALGNPGLKYQLTRHNAGFWTADILANEAGVSFKNAGLFFVAELPNGLDIIKPATFMNESGRAVKAFLSYCNCTPEDILVVCDDVNLSLGRLRVRLKGSHGGHNGLRNIIDVLGTEQFPRLRLGVGPLPQGNDMARYVLKKVPKNQREEASLMAHRAVQCVSLIIDKDYAAAQEKFNRPFEEEDRSQDRE